MKWTILYAVERTADLESDNINEVAKIAEEGKRKGERIVSIRTR